jgi:hypothetical protein
MRTDRDDEAGRNRIEQINSDVRLAQAGDRQAGIDQRRHQQLRDLGAAGQRPVEQITPDDVDDGHHHHAS